MIECHSYLKNSLFLVEDMGGNELNAIIPYKNITELRQMVPPIVVAIKNITSICYNKFMLASILIV